MKRRKIAKIAGIMLALSCAHSGLAGSVLSSISNNADNYLLNALNAPLPFVATAWSMMTNYYSQNSSFPPANNYAINTTFLPGVSSITNSSSGTLEIKFGPTAPGTLANNGFALAPTRVTLRSNTFYVYELTQCYTNITDALTSQETPQPGTAIGLFSNSNLGITCVYAPNPYSAAINQVQGGAVQGGSA